MNKLAIVGSHPSTRENAPYDDPAYDIWVFNEAAQNDWCKRWTACIQLHRPEVYMSPTNWINATHWEWLQQNHGRRVIYMQDYDELVPNSRRYPIDEICAELPAARFRWFTSSPSYALALALYLGYELIEIYGVEMTVESDYKYQIENWLYWVGVAKGMLGDDLVIKSGEVHYQARLYAYEGEIQIERDFYRKRAAQLETDWQFADGALRKAKERLDNAITDRKWADIPNLSIKVQDAALMCGELAGALGEAEKYAGREDPIYRLEFERRSSYAQQTAEQTRAAMFHEGGKVELTFNLAKVSGEIGHIQALRAFTVNQAKHAYDTGAHLGIYRDNNMYMAEYDLRLTAAGGERTRVALGAA